MDIVKNKKLLSLNDFYCNLKKQIDKNKMRGVIRTQVIKEFADKKLNINIPMQVFDNNLEIENLTRDEQICLCKAMYKATKVPILEPTNYFTSKEIDEYDMLVKLSEKDWGIVNG